ncbi:alpha/beta hydrolase [Pontibacter silvestris]|uniref:Alpha/beta hydrolase n=1 Tax=Pontibacter silvestris TaxID=2305183 RepID=A0ABW4WST2_9BACT|nr:alpha/beta hydrolase [Pontibacter silvestris]MCC9138595.1 alpha/beta hydrolase [Pontibacter silvestris]
MKIFFYSILTIITVAVAAYLLGPKPDKPMYSKELPEVPENLSELERYLRKKEGGLPVKPGNEAQIIWANDSARTQTEYAVIYLHGFSSSHEEGNPAHKYFAKKYGCNLLLTRLSDHGLKVDEPMLHFTADRLWNSALEAYAIGRRLGKKVILMSTSTGGTLSLKLAAEFPEIHSLIMFSPNIEIYNNSTAILNDPWGLQLARYTAGGESVNIQRSDEHKKYWYDSYRLEAVVQLQELVETTMTPETYNKVKQPVLLLYYYKDAQHQDNVVSVEAMQDMFKLLRTPGSQKRKMAIPEAGNHVIASHLRSKDVRSVKTATEQFAEEVLKMKPVEEKNGSFSEVFVLESQEQ